MRAAASVLIGRHDFSSFQARGASVLDGWRTLQRIEIARADDEIHIDVDGNGFLRHMVRIIVGTLVDIGVGTRPVTSMADALAARDRQAAGQTAPATGLVLTSVKY
jgi:tRNA pseudouridine38-40 synthase